MTSAVRGRRRVRVLDVIARMNVGGPAHHVSILSGGLDPARFETLLVTGTLGAGEGSFVDLAERHGARLVGVDHLAPEVGLRDLLALGALIRIMRRFRPDIVHTHTAKAGTLGRLAARIALGRRPIVVHTYHGHVLRGYFGPVTTAAYRAIEQVLARMSDVLIGVSQATVDDLVELGVAGPERFAVVPIGLDLERFLALSEQDAAPVRRELGLDPQDRLVLFAGRLVPVKRVDLLLRAVREALDAGAPIKLIVVGDGRERPALERLAAELELDGSVRFLGFRYDMPALVAAADIAVISSDNEGTPVTLIEAAAGGRTGVSTAVGGVRDILTPDTGLVVPPGDARALGRAMAALAVDDERRRALGARAREHVRRAYGADRLLRDVARLYEDQLAARGI